MNFRTVPRTIDSLLEDLQVRAGPQGLAALVLRDGDGRGHLVWEHTDKKTERIKKYMDDGAIVIGYVWEATDASVCAEALPELTEPWVKDYLRNLFKIL